MDDHKKSHVIPSVVLGVNDGLIELTGALVGFSFALREPKLVALTGLITGVAAALSMAASAFMQARHEDGKDAVEAGIYTGISYGVVVFILVIPFLIFSTIASALTLMLISAVIVIAFTTSYTSRVYKRRFSAEFGIMLLFSLGTAAIAFGIGLALSSIIGISI